MNKKLVFPVLVGPTHQVSYRPDVDGLRAIAILAVLGFHAFPAWLRGGFIGVDIFFVISGFLISKIIFQNLDQGTFSFFDFYSRRVKRIFPALLIILASSLFFGWYTLDKKEYQELGKHIAAGAGFVSNYVLWSEAGYFDRSAELKPLLHLWSLGIEEQFYIFWPIVTWMLWKHKSSIFPFIIIFFLITFLLNLKGVRTDKAATFYSPQTRIWELLSGAALAYVSLYRKFTFYKKIFRYTQGFSDFFYKKIRIDHCKLNNLMSFTGLSLLILGFIRINNSSNFPGVLALFPVLGAFLLISAGPNGWVNKRILSSKILVFIGVISFPLYLWHWPLLSFARIIGSENAHESIGFIIIFIAFFLSILTYTLVEYPLRKDKKGVLSTYLLLIVMVLIGFSGYYIYANNGMPQRYNNAFELSTSLYDKGGNLLENRVRDFNKCSVVKGVQDSWCRATKSPLVVLYGDSHAEQLFDQFYDSNHPILSRVKSVGAGNCPPFAGDSIRCDLQFSESLPTILADKSLKYVVVTSWNTVVSKIPNSFNELSDLISTIQRSGKKVIFIIDVPTLKFRPADCMPAPSLIMREKLKRYLPYCQNLTSDYFEDRLKYNFIIGELRKSFPDVMFFDPIEKFSVSGVYNVNLKGSLIYSDEGHLSEYGRGLLVDALVREFIERDY